MRHRVRGRKLGRNQSHRDALGKNLVASLFRHERITTTTAKAKEYKPMAERLITMARTNTLHNRRRAIALISDIPVVHKLFDKIAPLFKDRPGGYTRILKLQKPRLGDAGQQVIFELVEKTDSIKATAETGAETPETPAKGKGKGKAKAAKAETAEAKSEKKAKAPGKKKASKKEE